MQNMQVSNMMEMILFVMIVINIYANWSRKANISRIRTASNVKVTKKVIKCKKTKCHNFYSKTKGENPLWLRHLVVKIFPQNHCV